MKTTRILPFICSLSVVMLYVSCSINDSTDNESISVMEIKLDKSTLSMETGGIIPLIATLNPENATKQMVTWSSDAESVAMVSSTGLVFGVSAGNATITVTTVDGNKKANCFVNVSNALVSVAGVMLDKSTAGVLVGKAFQLTAMTYPTNATNQGFLWTSDAETVATVSQTGLVTGVSAGNATITVTTLDGNKKASCSISVSNVPVPATGVTLDMMNASVSVGNSFQLYASISPANATNQSATWESDTESIVMVSQAGLVTGVSVGSAIITVRTDDGNKTANCLINVTAPIYTVESVAIDKNMPRVLMGKTLQLNAIISPSNASNKSVLWSSDAESIATVSSTGLVTGVSAGGATITVKTADGGKIAKCSLAVERSLVEMVPVIGGTFFNGKTNMTVSSFLIGKYELTQKQYATIMGYIPYLCLTTNTIKEQYPVNFISWYDSIKFCNALSTRDGFDCVYTINETNVSTDFSKNGYRLPTEAEWEFAARGGNSTHGYMYSGSNTIGNVAYYSTSSIVQVGYKTPNELGIYDMSGNVFEWCNDFYGDYPTTAQINYTGPSMGQYTVGRGGCFAWGTSYCEVSYRGNFNALSENNYMGFRVMRRE